MKYNNSIFQNSEKFTNEGERIKSGSFSVESYRTEDFRKEVALHKWASIFNELGLEYLYKPRVSVDRKGMDGADFYLKDANAFVFVRGEKFCDGYASNYDIKDLVEFTQTYAIVAYDDGKFRLMDFYKNESENGVKYLAELTDESMFCRCRKCGEPFFSTNSGWWGCRHCGFYDGDNTASVCIRGDVGISEEKPAQIIEVPVEQKIKKNKR